MSEGRYKPRIYKPLPLPVLDEPEDLKCLRADLRTVENELAILEQEAASIAADYQKAALRGDLIEKIKHATAAEGLPVQLAAAKTRVYECKAAVAAGEYALLKPELERVRADRKVLQEKHDAVDAELKATTLLESRIGNRLGSLRSVEQSNREKSATVAHEATQAIRGETKLLLGIR